MIVIYEAGDPVRLEGRRGLFRFVDYPADYSQDCMVCGPVLEGTTASVIGPIGKSERLITVPVSDLKLPPPTATRHQVEMHPGVASLSARAKARRR